MSIVFDIFLSSLKCRTAPHESRFDDTSLAVIGTILLFFIIMAYLMSCDSDLDSSTHEFRTFQELKEMYRRKRDDFRSDPRAMEELLEWKRKNDHYSFKILYAFSVFLKHAMYILLE